MTGAVNPSPALVALRERTRTFHTDLDRSLLLGAPDAGRAQYARHVAAMWGWLQPLEAALWHNHWPAKLQSGERAHKASWLAQDIAAAHHDGFIAEVPALCPHDTDFSLPATRYGWAYVIEGSMLGGSVLHRRLTDRLQPWPMRYLQGYGAATGRRWRDFLEALDHDVREIHDLELACAAAAAAFHSIGNWLRQRGAA